MGRSLRTDIYRPDTCPKGHTGPIHIHHYSRWTPEHQKIQYACLPKGEKRHKFTMAMPPRQPTHAHPLGGQTCDVCERPYLVGQGPSCGHQFMFTVHEAAQGLHEVGMNHPIRSASQQVRRTALRKRQKPRPKARLASTKAPRSQHRHRWSDEGNLVATYIDLFAPVVLRALREEGDLVTEWPPAVAVDSFSLRTRLYKEGRRTSGGAKAGEIFAATGGTSNRDMKPIALQFLGGKDHQSALDFFATLGGAPTWVVADFDEGLELAVTTAWPDAVRYMCEAHILRLGQKAYTADKLYKLSNHVELSAALEVCQHNETNLGALIGMVNELQATTATNLRKWISDYTDLIRYQMVLRKANPGMPRSVGSAEELQTWVDTAIASRHGAWRNLTRVNHVLALMLAHRAMADGEIKYMHIIRRHLDANGGATGLKRPSDYKRFRDRVGDSSLRKLVRFATARARTRRNTQQGASRNVRLAKKIASTNVRLVQQGMKPITGRDHHRRPDGPARLVRRSVAKQTVADFPEYKAQWHPTKNGGRKPEDVMAGTSALAWWLCPVHPSHEWERPVVQRISKKQRCPFCTNRRVSPTNSLAGQRPDLAQEWHPSFNSPLTPADVIVGADKKVWWRCRICGEDWQATVGARALRDAGCRYWRGHSKAKQEAEGELFGDDALFGPVDLHPTQAQGEDPDLPF